MREIYFSDSEAGEAPVAPNHRQGIVRYLSGWTFTVTEERCMQRAMRHAREFMETFGKGITKTPMINRAHYGSPTWRGFPNWKGQQEKEKSKPKN